MQTRRNDSQSEMILLPSLEDRIPESYYLKRLNKILDLSFVHEMVRPLYCQDNGRPSIDPEVIVRIFLLQAITGTASVRQVLREADLHLGYRWFIGYGADEVLPDHSSLSRAIDRFGDQIFNEIFLKSIAQCKASGLIDGSILHIDATTIRADINKDCVNKPESSDADARFGHFPDGTLKPGYKQQTIADDKSRVILAIDITPANKTEGSDIKDVLDQAAGHTINKTEVVCADSAYASGRNSSECESRGIRFISPPRKAHNHYSGKQFPIEQFSYDEQNDVFICPAGKVLTKTGVCGIKPNRWKYSASKKDCGKCALKSQCTQATQRCLNVSGQHGSLIRLRADSKTSEFSLLYRKRAPLIEGIFAEAKQWHGLARAWKRGLMNVRIQCLLIAAVMNFKRLSGFISTKAPTLTRTNCLNRGEATIFRAYCLFFAEILY